MRPAPRRAYHRPVAGEWVQPVRDGYRIACCECGLVHILQFRTFTRGSGRGIEMRMFRDERATAAVRRKMKCVASRA